MKITTICENHLFVKAYSKGKRAISSAIAVHVLPDYKANKLMKSHPKKIRVNRLGFTVGKKIGGAVERSRARRVMREAYRMILKEYDIKTGNLIVIVARESLVGMKSTDVSEQMLGSFKKLGLIIGKKA